MIMTLGKRRVILALCVLAFLIAVPAVLYYISGYRLDSDFRLAKIGGIYVSSPISGSQIFIDSELKKETNILQNGLFVQSLKPKEYSIIVSKEGYWPWAKKITVKEQMVSEARAFLVSMEPKGEVIRKENFTPLEVSKYDEILLTLGDIKEIVSTTTVIKRIANHDRQEIYWNPSENKLWAEWVVNETNRPYYFSENKMLILDSKSPIRNAEFYPGRKDVIIIAVQNGVFAMEINGVGGRNLQPIYKGKEPIFTTYKNESSIYILDDSTLIKIGL